MRPFLPKQFRKALISLLCLASLGSAKVSRNWLNDTLTAEIAGIYTFRRQSHVIRPTLTYSISDRWQARFGADMYRGEEQTFFGRLRENSTVYIELRYGFDGD